MEKILVVGDLHCKMSLVLPRALDAAIANCCDAIIFVGDLCDDWGVDGEAMMRQLEFAASWREDATELGIETVFLLGNHDSAGRSKLVSCGPMRGGWGDPGPLWADRRELVCDSYTGCPQIVGHSPVESAVQAESVFGEALWFVDTLSLYRSGGPIGDATALVLCEGQATPVHLFDNWNEAIRPLAKAMRYERHRF